MFEKGRTVFPSRVHMSLYEAAVRMTPPEVSLPSIDDPVLRESAGQFHAFMLRLLEDMYEAPDAYGLYAGELEEFLQGRAINAMKQRQPSKTKALLSAANNAARWYQGFFHELGAFGEPAPDRLTLTAEEYDAFRASRGLKKIPFSIRLPALERVGLHFEENGGAVTVTSRDCPAMFPAMCALARACQPPRPWGQFHFENAEFRYMTDRKFKPVYADYLRPLADEQCAVADAVHAYTLERGLSIVINTYWKVNYHYKSRHVMCIDSEGRPHFTQGLGLQVRVNGGPRGWYDDEVAARGEAFKRYFLRHLNFCTGCATSHLGGITEVFGYHKRVCCCPSLNFHIRDPRADDLEHIRTFIDLRIQAIERERCPASSADAVTA